MNFHYALQKLRRRATCVKAASAKLGSEARIINIGGDDGSIRIGASTMVRGELLVFAHGGRIALGDWCYVGAGSRLWSGASITVGHRVMIAHGVNIFDNLTHPIDAHARHQHFRAIFEHGHPPAIDLGDRPVVVEDDAWIGAGATVLRGVTIDVAPDTVVAGNPARVVREL
jgi:acetyltransferase-like isoleucine patch superfamily enzyme